MHLAARERDAPVLQAGIGLGRVAPVELRANQRHPLARSRDGRVVVVGPAGLEQQHARRRIRRQAVGQHASGRAGADDDEVEVGAAWGLGPGTWGLGPDALPPASTLMALMKSRRFIIQAQPRRTRRTEGHEDITSGCPPEASAAVLARPGHSRVPRAGRRFRSHTRAATIVRRVRSPSLARPLCLLGNIRMLPCASYVAGARRPATAARGTGAPPRRSRPGLRVDCHLSALQCIAAAVRRRRRCGFRHTARRSTRGVGVGRAGDTADRRRTSTSWRSRSTCARPAVTPCARTARCCRTALIHTTSTSSRATIRLPATRC